MKNAQDLVMQAKAAVHEVTLADAEEAIRQADVLIDVREADEFAAGHLPGAVLVPRGLLEFKLSGTPALSGRDLKVVLYCKTSGRAALSAQSLAQMGYTHVRSIAGGVDAWQAAGHTLVKPAQPSFE
jgi:rhodanese-related sulfurtransferase